MSAGTDRAEIVHRSFLERVAAGEFPARHAALSLADSGLDPEGLAELFCSQVLSRQLDRTARRMQARGEGFYTIASSGHEGMAAVAAALRVDDMAFLHYRDAAFQIQRSRQLPGQTPTWDLLLSFAAAAEDPISGGRHKVLGSKALAIPPQTSTIASHLPKAVGAAHAIGLARRLRLPGARLPADAIIVASFGDASANHSTAQGAVNAAGWTAYQGIPMPLLLVCEDNGIGISTPTPPGWIEASFGARAGLRYLACDGRDVLDTYRAASEAARWVRARRRPVFLHLRCVRLYGHAGSDVESAYRSREEIEAAEADDPLLHTARLLLESGVMDAQAVLDVYREAGEATARVAAEVARRRRLASGAEVMASIVPPPVRPAPSNGPSPEAREALFAADRALMARPQHMARLLSWALADLMLEHPEIIVAGEDVGPKGGVYNVTSRLHARFGPARVINTLLDEQSILGLAIGLAHDGFLPIPEIQFLAYLHNAEDQIRGEAATLSFFSRGQYTNPMVVRIAGLGYQKGFGGHFHNDNSLAVLRDIPGIVLACPGNGADAVAMLRECVRLAREEQRVVVFVEPIALYMTRDLHAEGDGLMTCRYPEPGGERALRLGEVGVYGEGRDLAIVSYANGCYLARQAQRVLTARHGVAARVVDLRWLAPLPEEAILSAVAPCERVLVVDECRRTGSPSEALVALLAERAGHRPRVARITAEDSFIALGPAATATLPSRDGIVERALALARH